VRSETCGTSFAFSSWTLNKGLGIFSWLFLLSGLQGDGVRGNSATGRSGFEIDVSAEDFIWRIKCVEWNSCENQGARRPSGYGPSVLR
jgi:hypothetical protein